MQAQPWDVLVIGGGATGLGAAVEAAARGYRTLLIERSDFAKETSSRSTKLVHGGVRYLEQMNLTLVLDALRERGHMLRNAPHLVHDLSFVVPAYSYFSLPYYGLGLKVYERLSGRLSLGHSELLSRESTLERIPDVHGDPPSRRHSLSRRPVRRCPLRHRVVAHTSGSWRNRDQLLLKPPA